MRPTSKALELVQPFEDPADIADHAHHARALNPALSTREFSVIVTEAGMIHLLLPISDTWKKLGPGLKLKALALDYRQVEPRLESAGSRHPMELFQRRLQQPKGSFFTATLMSA